MTATHESTGSGYTVEDVRSLLTEEMEFLESELVMYQALTGAEQLLLTFIVACVVERDITALKAMCHATTPLHELFKGRSGAMGESIAIGPYNGTAECQLNAMRALASLGLALIDDESEVLGHAATALVWFDHAHIFLPVGTDLRRVEWGSVHSRRLSLLAELLADEPLGFAAVLWAAELGDPARNEGRSPARRSRSRGSAAIETLLDKGEDGQCATLQIRMRRELPPALVPDLWSMALFSGDAGFLSGLRTAWSQGGRLARGTVLWRLTDPAGPIDRVYDISLTGAFTVAVNEACRTSAPFVNAFVIRRIRARTAIVGGVDDGGRMIPVGGYRQKIEAAGKMTRVVVPRANTAEAQRARRTEGPEIIGADTWQEAAKKSRVISRAALRNRITAALVAGVSISAGILVPHVLHTVGAAQRTRDSQIIATYVEDHPSLSSDTAALLSVAAYRDSATPESIQALFDAYAGISPYSEILDSYADGALETFSADSDARWVSVTGENQAAMYDTGPNSASPVSAWTLPDVARAQISPDGRWLATIMTNGAMKIWSTATRRATFTLPYPAVGPFQNAGVLAWNPSSTLLAYSDGSETLRTLALPAGTERVMPTPEDAIGGYAQIGFGALSGDLYAVEGTGGGGSLYSWDPRTGATIESALNSLTGSIVSGHGDAIAACSAGHWRFTDPSTGAPIPHVASTLPCTDTSEARWLTDSTLVQTESPENAGGVSNYNVPGVGKVVDLRDGAVKSTFSTGSWSSGADVVAASSDGTRIVAATDKFAGYLQTHDPASQIPSPETSTVRPLLSPNGHIEVGFDPQAPGPASLWPQLEVTEQQTGAAVTYLPVGSSAGTPAPNTTVDGFEFAPDGTLITETGGVFERWNLLDHTRIGPGVRDPYASSLPLGSAFSTTSTGGASSVALMNPATDDIELWSLSPVKEVATIGPVPGGIDHWRLSPDGRYISVSTIDGNVLSGLVSKGSLSPALSDLAADDQFLAVLDDGAVAGGAETALYLETTPGNENTLRVPPQLQITQLAADPTGTRFQITMEYSADELDSPIGAPLQFSADPEQWAREICSVVSRDLQAGETVGVGAEVTDQPCG